MKTFKLIFASLFLSVFLNSCSSDDDNIVDIEEEVVEQDESNDDSLILLRKISSNASLDIFYTYNDNLTLNSLETTNEAVNFTYENELLTEIRYTDLVYEFGYDAFSKINRIITNGNEKPVYFDSSTNSYSMEVGIGETLKIYLDTTGSVYRIEQIEPFSNEITNWANIEYDTTMKGPSFNSNSIVLHEILRVNGSVSISTFLFYSKFPVTKYKEKIDGQSEYEVNLINEFDEKQFIKRISTEGSIDYINYNFK